MYPRSKSNSGDNMSRRTTSSSPDPIQNTGRKTSSPSQIIGNLTSQNSIRGLNIRTETDNASSVLHAPIPTPSAANLLKSKFASTSHINATPHLSSSNIMQSHHNTSSNSSTASASGNTSALGRNRGMSLGQIDGVNILQAKIREGGLTFDEEDRPDSLFGSERLRRAILEALSKGPKGPSSVHNVFRITATKPHLSMVVDKAVTLKPGSELFTFVMGPRDPAWKPFYQTANSNTPADNPLQESSEGVDDIPISMTS